MMAWHRIYLTSKIYQNFLEERDGLLYSAQYLRLQLKTQYKSVHLIVNVNQVQDYVPSQILVRTSNRVLLEYQIGQILPAFLRLQGWDFSWHRETIK